MLYQLFNEFPISYIKIAKDHQSRESFGYAFVGFKSHSKADEAIARLNYSKLGKKTIRISWYNREPNNFRSHPEFNVFVKKVNKATSHKEFHDHFTQFGNVISAKLAEDDEGEVVGYGFVLYDSAEGAEKAIKSVNSGTEFKGKKMFAGTFIKNKPKRAVQFNNIYVRNIPKRFSKDDIEKFFSKYGAIGSMIVQEPDLKSLEKLPEEKRNGILEHKYAFICFKDFDAAKRVVNEVPYYKLKDTAYNTKVDEFVALLKKSNVEEDHLRRCAVFLLENNEDSVKLFTDANLLKEQIEAFCKHIKENDGVYLVKDKSDRMDCCQALKKQERVKRLKALYEKIKRSIKDKYKFCNLYVKNLPDNFSDEKLRELFAKFGEIRSCKSVKKELFTSYLGIKRSTKVFGYVCFFEPAQAREAKTKLNESLIPGTNQKLFVDYHQSKQERGEYLKLKMINQNNKIFNNQKGKLGDVPPMMRNLPQNMRALNSVFGPHMLRKFPPQTMFVQPKMSHPNMYPHGQMGQMGMMPQQQFQQYPNVNLEGLDKNARRDFFGEKLYTKISSNPQFSSMTEYFSKIVGIFLDLDDAVIERLINDEQYFGQQVYETVRLLNEKTGSN